MVNRDFRDSVEANLWSTYGYKRGTGQEVSKGEGLCVLKSANAAVDANAFDTVRYSS